jgi:hypothetical protein
MLAYDESARLVGYCVNECGKVGGRLYKLTFLNLFLTFS